MCLCEWAHLDQGSKAEKGVVSLEVREHQHAGEEAWDEYTEKECEDFWGAGGARLPPALPLQPCSDLLDASI